jgi:hypothetical protein
MPPYYSKGDGGREKISGPMLLSVKGERYVWYRVHTEYLKAESSIFAFFDEALFGTFTARFILPISRREVLQPGYHIECA